MEEPSVLDYLKDRLSLRRLIHRTGTLGELSTWTTGLPPAIDQDQDNQAEVASKAKSISQASRLPWLALGALFFALIAQRSFEPPSRSAAGIVGYLLAGLMLVGAIWKRQVRVSAHVDASPVQDPFTARKSGLLTGLIASILTFLAFGGGNFTSLNLTLWVVAIFGFLWAFWIPKPQTPPQRNGYFDWLKSSQWQVALPREGILILAIAAVILYFRLSLLSQVPPEMVSDHAEKLLDVWDVLQGQTPVFFPRNTGREAMQMYLTAGIALLFGTGISFPSLKIGMVLAGLLTLPFLYLAGSELGNRRIGVIAVMFAGVAYWPNVISRIALRFALYPLFVAPALYFLLRGLRTSNRNDFILTGIFLGLGLHGYSPYRIVPLVVVVAFGLFLLHRQSWGQRSQAAFHLLVLSVVTLVVFLPLLRYMVDNSHMFLYRSMTRMGSLEKPLEAPAGQIFANNLLKALAMFAWDDGEVWVVSIPHRPALSVASAVLFHLGALLVLVRYIQKRHWVDIFLLLSVPLLMLPSILSLAYPAENPILNRTSGAIVPVFIISGIALDSLMTALESGLESQWGKRLGWLLCGLLFIGAAVQDHDLVFRQYRDQYALSAWNYSEMGEVLCNFTQSIGTPGSAWVVAYPYWVDTRLVGIEAGYVDLNPVILPTQLADTQTNPGAKLFLLYPQDSESLEALKKLYPSGVMKEYTSKVPEKNFWMYFVPPNTAVE
ncbi:MAG: glycosyltransferase family 39 protein [Anaerolineales bacterium]|nr:glycosyltransferase family 39 protein [Anaerolineales bacterium]